MIDPTAPLVVTDLDGSFWDHDLRCHPSTLDAVAELDRRGVPLLVATGRRANSAHDGLVANGLRPPAVLLNGALGVDLASGERFHRHALTAEAATAVLAALAAIGLAPVMYLPDGSTTGPAEVTTGREHRASMATDYLVADPAEVVARQEVLSMAMIGMPRHQVAPVAEAVPDHVADVMVYADHLYTTLAGAERWSVHIQPLGISKWDGIQAFLGHAGLRPRHIVAVGDGTNDLEMLANADVALGVDGGHAEVRAVADEVIPSPSDGGWRRVLDFVES